MKPINKSELKKVRETIALLNSMIKSGEDHSGTSEAHIAESLKIIDKCQD